MHKLQSVHPKQNQKQITHKSNILCMLQTGRKTIESVEKNKNFINIIGDTFTLAICQLFLVT